MQNHAIKRKSFFAFKTARHFCNGATNARSISLWAKAITQLFGLIVACLGLGIIRRKVDREIEALEVKNRLTGDFRSRPISPFCYISFNPKERKYPEKNLDKLKADP